MSLRSLVIRWATDALAYSKRNRRLPASAFPAPLKLNLGCGLAVAPGWVNIDGSLNAVISGLPPVSHRLFYRLSGSSRYYSLEEYCALLGNHRFVHHDLASGIPFADGCADVVYSSHFLEHLPREPARHLVSEALRVLRPGGRIRLCVPDLEHAIRMYQQGDKEQMLQNYFFVEDHGSKYASHKYMYDFELLSALLTSLGFVNIRRYPCGEGELPDLEKLDNRPGETLYVEAEKPASNAHPPSQRDHRRTHG